jgi:hypothetical protein
MPLLFFGDAFIVKIVSLFGFAINNELIMTVVKVIDTLTFPLILIPLYKIMGFISLSSFKTYNRLVLAFAVLSAAPLTLVSGMQKNALAIVFLMFCLSYLFKYQHEKSRRSQLFAALFFLLTGLTHFGTFSVALLFIGLAIVFTYKWRAVKPMIIVVGASLGLIFLFDSVRFYRILFVWQEIIDYHSLLNSHLPTSYLITAFSSWLVAVVLLVYLFKNKTDYTPKQRAILFACIFSFIAFPFPFFEEQYFFRLSLFLVIPQLVVLLFIGPKITVKYQKYIAFILVLNIAVSLTDSLRRPRYVSLNERTYVDIQKMNEVIKADSSTIIVARHNLEFWIAWLLHTNVAQESAINEAFYVKYKRVIFLNQVSKRRKSSKKKSIPTKKKSPFNEPTIPDSAQLIYRSKYFEAYEISHK